MNQQELSNDKVSPELMSPAKPAELPRKTLLSEYTRPAFQVPDIALRFDLDTSSTVVTNKMRIRRGAETAKTEPLRLKGPADSLISLALDGRPLSKEEYVLNEGELVIATTPDEYELTIVTRINPQANKSGAGLYMSSGAFCTQMEAQGFRKVTFHPDRPDVMGRFTTTISGDANKLPVMVSNGNMVADHTDSATGRRTVTYVDPFPKPTYLFALVAGDLACIKDTFTTMSGKKVGLEFYVKKGTGDEERCGHAVASLKQAMRWDEEVFGLEYDLDTYRVVAVPDFNAGAMENKGLNIFNSVYVLADPETATDGNYEGIQGVIAHEYFHNWTGNRVTCRDWFQLTLKEGLTVFRDQEFSSDMNSRAQKRINVMNGIRTAQFTEDSGPNAHPIKPAEYIEIDNFYTSTVYSKGAEVIGMIRTLIGKEAFIRGIREYFELYDGQAVTTEDFLHAMHLASGYDFSVFERWYNQAGTPEVEVEGKYLPEEKVYEMKFRQSCPPTQGQKEKKPFLIPFAVGLLDRNGKELPVTETNGARNGTTLLTLSEPEHVFRFTGIESEPVPSLLRNFSAPVRVKYNYSEQDLTLLLANDTDPVNRYDASCRLALSAIRTIMDRKEMPSEALMEAYGRIIADGTIDGQFKASLLGVPSLDEISEGRVPLDYEKASLARKEFLRQVALRHEAALKDLYDGLTPQVSGEYRRDSDAISKRALRNRILGLLLECGKPEYQDLALKHYEDANCMNDKAISMAHLRDYPGPQLEKVLSSFEKRWNENSLVMNKWFAVQAGAERPDVIEQIKKLEKHECFDAHNPNMIRALYGAFSAGNLVFFNASSGEGYTFLTDKILEIDGFNPNVAARLVSAFKTCDRMDKHHRELVCAQMRRLLEKQGVSPGVYEIAAKTLEACSAK